jgi:hypothetical protein
MKILKPHQIHYENFLMITHSCIFNNILYYMDSKEKFNNRMSISKTRIAVEDEIFPLVANIISNM